MNHLRRWSLCAALLALASPAFAQAPACPLPLLVLDDAGAVVAGSRAAVRAAAQRGDPLRIGWGFRYGPGEDEVLQHWADATFVTLFEGETFAQIAPIHRQSPLGGRGRVALADAAQLWHASLGTDGRLVSRFGDDAAPSERQVAQTWCLAGPAATRCLLPAWRALYRHDADGMALEGGKQALFDAVRRGDPLRLSWGMVAGAAGEVGVEHAADPVFVTIASNREVYAQLAEHPLQQRYHEVGKAAAEQPNVMWRAVIGTDGRFDATWTDRADADPQVHFPQRAAVTWHAYAPDPSCDPRPVPTLAIPDGVRRVDAVD